MRYNLYCWERVLISLDRRHVCWRQLAFAGEQVTDALGAIAVQPLVRDVIRVIIVHYAVICCNNEMLLRVKDLRQLFKGDKARPLIFARPAWRGQQVLALCANGNSS